MIDKVELLLETAAIQLTGLWLAYWQRHGDDEVYSRPHWC
jgi:hypothetical protein